MSFADELRAYDPNSEQKRIMHTNIQRDVSLFTGILKQACTNANQSNKKSVSIYCIRWVDDGYTENGYIEKLPTVQDYIEKANRFNKEKYHTYSTYHGASTGKSETRLYGQLIYFDSSRLDYTKELQKELNNEISKMGFTSYRVSLVCLDDTYIIHNRTAGLFSGTVKENVSTRVSGKIYTFLFQVSW